MSPLSVCDLPPPPAGCRGWPWTSESSLCWGAERKLPSITVVTPSFNQGQYIEACIRSVLLQGYPNLEFIVQDGGSTDGTLEVLRRYEPWLTRWHSGPDRGQYDAINRGFEGSGGQVMAYLNSDDMLMPDSLRAVGDIFQACPDVEWLTTRILCVYSSRGALVECVPVEGFSRARFRQGCYLGGTSQFIQHIQQESTFWTRSLWERAGGAFRADLNYAGDLEAWGRFFDYADLYAVSLPLGGNRVQPEQKTANMMAYTEEGLKVLGGDMQRTDGSGRSGGRSPSVHKRMIRAFARRMGITSDDVPTVSPEDRTIHGIYFNARAGEWVRTASIHD